MKNKFMKTIVAAFLGLLMFASVTQIFVSGRENETQVQQTLNIVGVWQTTVTPRNCQTGEAVAPAFQGLLTFNQGGTMAEVAAGSSPALRSPGHGVWKAGNQFHPTIAFTFIRFNPDGTFAGRNTIRQTANFPQNNQFTTTGTLEVFAANGSLIASGCSTSTVTRFE
jgi:hypothetical protein